MRELKRDGRIFRLLFGALEEHYIPRTISFCQITRALLWRWAYWPVFLLLGIWALLVLALAIVMIYGVCNCVAVLFARRVSFDGFVEFVPIPHWPRIKNRPVLPIYLAVPTCLAWLIMSGLWFSLLQGIGFLLLAIIGSAAIAFGLHYSTLGIGKGWRRFEETETGQLVSAGIETAHRGVCPIFAIEPPKGGWNWYQR